MTQQFSYKDDIDELVHDKAAGFASDAINSGSQLDFLVNTCDLTPAEILQAVGLPEGALEFPPRKLTAVGFYENGTRVLTGILKGSHDVFGGDFDLESGDGLWADQIEVDASVTGAVRLEGFVLTWLADWNRDNGGV